MHNNILTLDYDDQRVINARNAEKILFDHYGFEAKEHFVTLPYQQLKIRVLEIGKGEPLVIVPGNTGDVFPMASLIAEIKGRRILAINRPGGGLSEGMDHTKVDMRRFAVETLDTVFEAFDINFADVLAHSMGAHWSTLLAIEHPVRIRKLVLMGNPGNIMAEKPPLSVQLFGKPAIAKFAMKAIIPTTKQEAIRILSTMGHSDETIDKLPGELADAYLYFQHLPHYEISAMSLIQNMIPEIKKEELSNLLQPTALILGTDDNFASQGTGKKIIDAMPHGTFYSIEDAGHLPWLEDPGKCARLILDFFDTQDTY